MDLILGKPLKRYFLEHVKRDDKQYVVTKPLHVFKKIRTGGRPKSAIANLIIPVGARVNAPRSVFDDDIDAINRKMRASLAYTHSIHAIGRHGKDYGPLQSGHSRWDQNFRYEVDRTVEPKSFNHSRTVCAPGIHFFLNLRDALYYNF